MPPITIAFLMRPIVAVRILEGVLYEVIKCFCAEDWKGDEMLSKISQFVLDVDVDIKKESITAGEENAYLYHSQSRRINSYQNDAA